MEASFIIEHALKQQELQSKPDAACVFAVKASRWPKSGRLRLFSGGRGPWGTVVATQRGGFYLTQFSAHEVIQACRELQP